MRSTLVRYPDLLATYLAPQCMRAGLLVVLLLTLAALSILALSHRRATNRSRRGLPPIRRR